MDKSMEAKFYEMIQHEPELLGITPEEMREKIERARKALLKLRDALKVAFEKIYEFMKIIIEKIIAIVVKEIEKMKMSNNERRRRGIPLIRRRAYVLHRCNRKKNRV